MRNFVLKPSRGFTLVELMIAISIAALLLIIALPSFRDIIRKQQLVSTSNTFLADAALARTEAIKANSGAVLCIANAAGGACQSLTTTASDWSTTGWLVSSWSDTGNNTVEASELTIIRRQLPLSTDLSFQRTTNAGAASSGPRALFFNNRGLPITQLGAPLSTLPIFTLKPANCTVGQLDSARRFTQLASGAMRMARNNCP